MNLRSTLNFVALAFILHTFHACATPLPLINTIDTRNLMTPSADSGVNARTSGEINAPGSLAVSPMSLSIRSDPDSSSEMPEIPSALPIVKTIGHPVETAPREQFNARIRELIGYLVAMNHYATNILEEFCSAMELIKPYPDILRSMINSPVGKFATNAAESIVHASSLSSTSSSGSTAQTSHTMRFPKETESAATKYLSLLPDDRSESKISPERLSDPRLKSWKESLERLGKLKSNQVLTRDKLQDTTIAILELWERIIREETDELTAGDQRYTKKDEGGNHRSYRDAVVLPGIRYAKWAHEEKRQVLPRVREAAGICLAKMKAIDDRIMGKEHTIGGK